MEDDENFLSAIHHAAKEQQREQRLAETQESKRSEKLQSAYDTLKKEQQRAEHAWSWASEEE